jgi:phosphoribosylformylglycinamidine synthase subunit PurQ / glutaminase
VKPKALVLQAHGTNRDLDVTAALTLVGADPIGVPLNDLRARKTRWSDFQLLVLPGGFSYADALGAGKLLAIDLTSYFVEEISTFVESGKPVIGICNGFQALVRSGILPSTSVIARRAFSPTKQSHVSGDMSVQQEIASLASERLARNDTAKATLTFNERGHFECRWVNLKPISHTCLWTKDLDKLITCPIAHGEGNFQVADDALLSTFQSQDQIALTYTCPDGSSAKGDYPANPNGSILDIAGICNPQGNVLGLMPHPENHIYDYQHPRYARGEKGGSGLRLFENGVKYAKAL